MSSWRDSTSPEAQVDLDQLVGAALGMAQQLLAANHEFYPFAAAVTDGGDVELIAGRPEAADDMPSSASVLASCEAVLRSRLSELRAAALVADVRTPTGEAIQADLEHSGGPALRILLPYERHRLGRVKKYGELEASEGVRRFWTGLQD